MPRITPQTLPRLRTTSIVTNRLTTTIVSSRYNARFSGVLGTMRPVEMYAAMSRTGMVTSTTRRAGVGNNSAGETARRTGISRLVMVRAQRATGELDTQQI